MGEELNNNTMETKKSLTHDEKKASEAAFQGRPFNPQWSKSARAVYDGIREAMGDTAAKSVVGANEAPALDSSSAEVAPQLQPQPQIDAENPNQIITRSDALKAGLLVDVTSSAQKIGLHIPVGITKSLWEGCLNPGGVFSEEECNQRIRDLLMAVRLRLALAEISSPWIEVPVLLPFQPDPTPQLFSIYALFHKDAVALDCLTLLHPQELSSIHPTQSPV